MQYRGEHNIVRPEGRRHAPRLAGLPPVLGLAREDEGARLAALQLRLAAGPRATLLRAGRESNVGSRAESMSVDVTEISWRVRETESPQPYSPARPVSTFGGSHVRGLQRHLHRLRDDDCPRRALPWSLDAAIQLAKIKCETYRLGFARFSLEQ